MRERKSLRMAKPFTCLMPHAGGKWLSKAAARPRVENSKEVQASQQCRLQQAASHVRWSRSKSQQQQREGKEALGCPSSLPTLAQADVRSERAEHQHKQRMPQQSKGCKSCSSRLQLQNRKRPTGKCDVRTGFGSSPGLCR